MPLNYTIYFSSFFIIQKTIYFLYQCSSAYITALIIAQLPGENKRLPKVGLSKRPDGATNHANSPRILVRPTTKSRPITTQTERRFSCILINLGIAQLTSPGIKVMSISSTSDLICSPYYSNCGNGAHICPFPPIQQ